METTEEVMKELKKKRLVDSAESLEVLHMLLTKLQSELDDDEIVPNRYEGNLIDCLVDMDSNMIGKASDVVHRLSLNVKFRETSRSNYIDVPVKEGEL